MRADAGSARAADTECWAYNNEDDEITRVQVLPVLSDLESLER
jgi:hypothetical protein